MVVRKKKEQYYGHIAVIDSSEEGDALNDDDSDYK